MIEEIEEIDTLKEGMSKYVNKKMNENKREWMKMYS